MCATFTYSDGTARTFEVDDIYGAVTLDGQQLIITFAEGLASVHRSVRLIELEAA